MDLPSVLAYGVYIGEIVAPILLIVGIWTRLAALVIVINMVVAVVLALMPHLFEISNTGGYALEIRGDVPVHRPRAGADRRRPLQRRRPLRAVQLERGSSMRSRPGGRSASLLALPVSSAMKRSASGAVARRRSRWRRCRRWRARTAGSAPTSARPGVARISVACVQPSAPASPHRRERAHRSRAVGEHATARARASRRMPSCFSIAATCAPAVERSASGKVDRAGGEEGLRSAAAARRSAGRGAPSSTAIAGAHPADRGASGAQLAARLQRLDHRVGGDQDVARRAGAQRIAHRADGAERGGDGDAVVARRTASRAPSTSP